MEKPFIYIGALRRTGSTMLCEALTQLPYSVVFNEPNIGSRRFAVRNQEAELLRELGLDLHGFVRRWSVFHRRFLLFGFRRRLVPALLRRVEQVGVKEIFHANWQQLVGAFPRVRIILTARDPRDIYLSLKTRYAAGNAIWSGSFTPERVAENLNVEFGHQLDMARARDVLPIRYEDLCLEPDLIRSVLDYVESNIPDVGELGAFLRSDRRRAAEGQIHGGRITDKRVARWRQETGDAAEEAWQVYDLMKEYREYWKYGKDGPLEFTP